MLCLFGQLIDILTAEFCRSLFNTDAPYVAACSYGVGKDFERSAFDDLIQALQFKSEPGIRLVASIAFHGFVISDSRKRNLQIFAEKIFKQPFHKAFLHFNHVVLIDKGHLQVDLGKFRLSVGPQIFVTEALCNLHISIAASHHQQLLEQLRRLRQRIKPAYVHPARNQIISGPFRSRLDQHRRFNFCKALLVKVISRDLCDIVTKSEILLHLQLPQIEISVFETKVVVYVIVVFDVNRRCFRFGVDRQFSGEDFDFSGRDVRIL